MKKPLIVVILAGATLTFLYLACIDKVDGGYIVKIGNSFYDPIGITSEITNAARRDCSNVENIETSNTHAKSFINAISTRLGIGDPSIKLMITLNEWAIIESEFSQGEPLSFLINEENYEYKVIATWGGSAAPFKTSPAIRSYFATQAPATPIQLLQCYDPVTPPFTSNL